MHGVCIMAFSSIFTRKKARLSLRAGGSADNLWNAVLKCDEPLSRGSRTVSCAPVVYSQKISNAGKLCCDKTLVDVLHTIVKPTVKRTGLLDLVLESIAQDTQTLVISQEEDSPTPLVTIQPVNAFSNEHTAVKVVEKHIVNVSNVRKKRAASLQPMGKMWVTAEYRVSSPKNSPGHYLLSDLNLAVGSFKDNQVRKLNTRKSEFHTPPTQQGEKQVVKNDEAVEKYCANLLSERTNNIRSIDIPATPGYKLKRTADAVTRNRGKTPWDLIRDDIKYDFAEEGNARIIEGQTAHEDKMQLHCVSLLGGMQCDPKLVNVLKHVLKPTAERGRLLDFLESSVQQSNIIQGTSTNIKISATGITKTPTAIVRPIVMADRSVSAVRVVEAHCVKVMQISRITGKVQCIGALEAIVQFTLFTTDDPAKCKFGDLKVSVKPIDSAGRSTDDKFTHSSTYTSDLPINPEVSYGHTMLGEEKFHVSYEQDVILPKNHKGILPTNRVKLKHNADQAMLNVAKSPWDLIATGICTPSSQPGSQSKLQLFDNIGRGIGQTQRNEQMVEFARNIVQPTSTRPNLLKFLEKCIDTRKPSLQVVAHSSGKPSLQATLTYVTEGVTFPMVKVEEIHLVDVIDISGRSQRASDFIVGKPDGIPVQDVLQVKLSYEISDRGSHYTIENMRAEITSMGQNGNKEQDNPLVVNLSQKHNVQINSMKQSEARLRTKAKTALEDLAAGRQSAVSEPSAGGKTGGSGEAYAIALKSVPDQEMRNLAKTPWDLICAGDEHNAASTATSSNDNVEKFTKEYLLKPTQHREGLLKFVKACVQGSSELDMATRAPKIEVSVEQDDNGLPAGPVVVKEEHHIRISRASEVLGFLVVQVDYRVNETTREGQYTLSDMKVAVKLLEDDGKASPQQELKYNIRASEIISRPEYPNFTHGKSSAKTLHLDSESEDEQTHAETKLREKSQTALKKVARGSSHNGGITLAAPKACQDLVNSHGLCKFVLGKDWSNKHKSDSGATPNLENLGTDEQLVLLSEVLDTKPSSTHELLLSALEKCISTSGVTLAADSVQVKRQNIVNSEGVAVVEVEEEHNVKATTSTKSQQNVKAKLSYLVSPAKTAQNVAISNVKLKVAVEGTNIEQDISFNGEEIVTIPNTILRDVAKKLRSSTSGEEEHSQEFDGLETCTVNGHDIEHAFKEVADEAKDITEALSSGSTKLREKSQTALKRVARGSSHNGGITLAAPKACQDLVNSHGLCKFVLGKDWSNKHKSDSGATPNLENLGTDEQLVLLSEVLDTKPSSTHELLLSALEKCISTSGVTLAADSVQVKRQNIVNSEGVAVVEVEEEHNVKATTSTKSQQNVKAKLSYLVSPAKTAQNVAISNVKLKVAVEGTNIEQDISFNGEEIVTIPNTILRDVAKKLRSSTSGEEEHSQEFDVDTADERRASSHSARQSSQHSTTHTKQSAGTGNMQVPSSATPLLSAGGTAQRNAGHVAASTAVNQDLASSTPSAAQLTLKSAPDQEMRDAVPNPWKLIYAGHHHSSNSKNATSGDITEFCSKYICRGADKRDGLLDFIKASIHNFDPASMKVTAGSGAKASMRAVGNKKVVTENHKFAVKDAKNEELYALEAEVQYTVSPTVRQDTYKISDLTVKIQPRGSDTALIYTSNNTSEVSLPKPKVATGASQKPLTSLSASANLAGTGASLEQRVATTVSTLATVPARSTDPQQSAHMSEYLHGISTPSSSARQSSQHSTTHTKQSAGTGNMQVPSSATPLLSAGGTAQRNAGHVAASTAVNQDLASSTSSAAPLFSTGSTEDGGSTAQSGEQSVQHSATASSQSTSTEQPSSQPTTPTQQTSSIAQPAHRLKSNADQVMRDAAPNPWSLIYGEHEPEPGGNSSSIQNFLQEFLLKPTRRRKGLLEFVKACMHDGGSLGTHATSGPKITLKASDSGKIYTVEEVHNIQVKRAREETVLDVLEVKVSYKVSSTSTDGEYSLSDLSVVVQSLECGGDSPSGTELRYKICTTERVSWQQQPDFKPYVVPALGTTNYRQQSTQERLRTRATETLLLAARQGSAQPPTKSMATQTGGASAAPCQIALHSEPECSEIHNRALSLLILGEEWHNEHGRGTQHTTENISYTLSSRDAKLSLLSAVLDTAPNVTNGCLLDALQNCISTREIVCVAQQDVAPVVTTQVIDKDGSPKILVQEEHEAIAKYLPDDANLQSTSDALRAAAAAKNLGRVNAVLSYTMSIATSDNSVCVVISDVKLVVAILDTDAVQTIEFKNAKDEVTIAGKLLQDVVEKLHGRVSVGTQSADTWDDIVGNSNDSVLYAPTTASKASSDTTEQNLAEREPHPKASRDEDATNSVVDTAAGEEGCTQRSKAAGKAPSSTKTAPDDKKTPTREGGSAPQAEQDDIGSDTDSEVAEPSSTQAKRFPKAKRSAATMKMKEPHARGFGARNTDEEEEEELDTDDDYEEHHDERDLLGEYEEDSMGKSGMARTARPAQHHIRSGRTQYAGRTSSASGTCHQTQWPVIKKTELFALNGRFNFVDEVRSALRRDSFCQEIFCPTDDDVSFETNLLMRIAEVSVAPLGPEVAKNLQIIGEVNSEVNFSEPQQEYDVVKGATIDAGIHGTFYISVQYQIAKEASVYSTNYVIKNAAIHLGRDRNSGTTVLPMDDIVSVVDTPWRAALTEYDRKQSIFHTGTPATGDGAQKSKATREKKRMQQKQRFMSEFAEENALHTVPVGTEKRGWLSKILEFVCKFLGKIFKFLKNLFGVRNTAHDNFAKYEADTSELIEDEPDDSHAAHLSRTSNDVHRDAQAEADTMYHNEYDDDDEYPTRYNPVRSLPSEVVSDSTIHPASVRTTATRKGRR